MHIIYIVTYNIIRRASDSHSGGYMSAAGGRDILDNIAEYA
jgi:hypothetical protein